MGYLLKEALKALCGGNQWSYAVFWKIGCQNPKLLIWEECYHGTLSCPDAPHNPTTGNHGLINLQKLEGYQNAAQVGELVGDRVRVLMDKMMMSNHVNMVGQGLVGRAAFTGHHQWVVSGNFNEKAHPAEVANEIRLQFSAGMQTVVVIPVVPHGVVQLGSPLAIMENVGFVHDARSLILQVGCVPSAFASDDYVTKDSTGMFGQPICDLGSVSINLHGGTAGMNYDPLPSYYNLQRNSSQAQRLVNHSSNSLVNQFQDNLQVSAPTFPVPNLAQGSCRSQEGHGEAKINSILDSSVLPSGLLENRIAGGVVVPSKTGSLISHATCSNNPEPSANFTQSSANFSCCTLLKQPIASQKGLSKPNDEISTISSSTSTSLFKMNQGHCPNLQGYGANLSRNTDFIVRNNGQNSHSSQRSACANVVFHDADPSVKELLGLLKTPDQLSSGSCMSTGIYNAGDFITDKKHTMKHISGELQNSDVHEVLKMPSETQEQLLSCDITPDSLCNGSQILESKDLMSEDTFFQSTAGDDLFDVLGVDFKNKLLNGNDYQFGTDTKDPNKDSFRPIDLQNLESQVPSDYEGIPESCVFPSSISDHLLDAVISGISSASKHSDDNVSCRTTVSKMSSPVPSTPHSNPSVSGLVNMPDRMNGQLLGASKPMVRLCDPIGGFIRSGCDKKDGGSCSITSSAYGSQISSWVEQRPSTSVSTANSKKTDEAGKSNRKRLKPGENPRPRPKDRQMIQDRVKELREIVPNGAKCSIDALLERTIKHMLFLQSVTKHAEKLKQTVEPKIASKEGGMLLNDQFEGGATWAVELGSPSMVCPIVVEDLNPPRQLLIEMLCEERGLFLEIADIVRGLGLTILKGVMEARNDKIWARFAVEANRDVTRMEVFISLVHLLEQTLKGRTSGNSRIDEKMALHAVAPMPSEQQLVG